MFPGLLPGDCPLQAPELGRPLEARLNFLGQFRFEPAKDSNRARERHSSRFLSSLVTDHRSRHYQRDESASGEHAVLKTHFETRAARSFK